MLMKHGQVWLVKFPFEERDGLKVRPVIIIDDGEHFKYKVLGVKVTSRLKYNGEYDIPLLYWQHSKLRIESIARVNKIAYLERDDFVRYIGELHKDDLLLVEYKLAEFFSNN